MSMSAEDIKLKSLNHVKDISSVNKEKPRGQKRCHLQCQPDVLSLVRGKLYFDIAFICLLHLLVSVVQDFFFFGLCLALAGCFRKGEAEKWEVPCGAIPGITWSFFLSFCEAKKKKKKLPGSVTSAFSGSWKSVIPVNHLWSLIPLTTEPVKLLRISCIYY